MIRSYRDKDTEATANGERVRRIPSDIAERARVMIRRVDAAERLDDLRIPPGNRLEALSGDRAGQHSVRINRQWRLCFRWSNGDAHDVEITDYH